MSEKRMDGLDERLLDAFVAGFAQSDEGYNAEFPFDGDLDDIRSEIEPEFHEWNGTVFVTRGRTASDDRA